jgi:hypothetical protein
VPETGNIVKCIEYLAKPSKPAPPVRAVPKTLRELGLERILERQVIEWSPGLGSYGMGGPGFFGLKMAATGQYPEEWLVLRLWAADNWLLLDGQWMAAHPNQYEIQRPLYSNFAGEECWDHVTERLVGATITRADIEENSSRIELCKEGKAQVLEIPEDTSRLPIYGGSLEPRVWRGHESQLDAWIIARGELFC